MTLLALSSTTALEDVLSACRAAGVSARAWPLAHTPLVEIALESSEVARIVDGIAGVRATDLRAPVLSTRALREEARIVDVGSIAFGGRAIPVIAGPCSIDDEERLTRVVGRVKREGAALFRAGAFKARTSPFAFQGHGLAALDAIARTKRAHHMPAVAEVLTPEDVGPLAEVCDVLQVGARSMQNTALLKALGRTRRPVLLKRGLASTVDELLCAADYVLAEGNDDVILCERGVRTFEGAVRFSLDVTSLALLKTRTRLPVVVDPSHAGGRADLVLPVARAGIAAGADGLLVEVHDDPAESLSDGEQALTLDAFATLMRDVERIARAVDRTIARPERAMEGVQLVA